jgi:hypothetical protein
LRGFDIIPINPAEKKFWEESYLDPGVGGRLIWSTFFAKTTPPIVKERCLWEPRYLVTGRGHFGRSGDTGRPILAG